MLAIAYAKKILFFFSFQTITFESITQNYYTFSTTTTFIYLIEIDFLFFFKLKSQQKIVYSPTNK